MARKPKPLNPEFLEWAAGYNQWRIEFGYPPMVPARGLENLYFCALRSAKLHEASWPTWEELAAGARHGPIGTGFTMHAAIWLLLPKGDKGECHLVDKNVQKLARWGRKSKPIQRGPALMAAKKRDQC